jgi:Heterokaryon incompatibility protein (HET)
MEDLHLQPKMNNVSSIGIRYEPISKESRDIRLAKILPGKYTDTLEIMLSNVSLNDDLNYTALSYTWGDSSNTCPITVNGHCVQVRVNLANAFLHIRKLDEDVVIWADALCINQDDISERDHQVFQMKDIYMKASKTIIYLGNDNGGYVCYSALNFLQSKSDWIKETNSELYSNLNNAVSFRGGLDDVELAVLERPWFRRVWVLQELVVSKNPFVQCGSRSTTWDDFCKVVLLEKRVHDRYGDSWRKRALYDYVRDMFEARWAFILSNSLHNLIQPWYHIAGQTKGNRSDILSMLERGRRLSASEPRDKVFALLGISTGIDTTDKYLAIDYAKPISEIYMSLATYMIERASSYDIFSHVTDVSNEEDDGLPHYEELYGSSLLPSWVPRWNRQSKYTRTILSKLGTEHGNVLEMRRSQVRDNHKWLTDGLRLHCTGRIIGMIQIISPQIILTGGDEIRFQRIRDALHNKPQQVNSQILSLWESMLVTPSPSKIDELRPPNQDSPKAPYFVSIFESPSMLLQFRNLETSNFDAFERGILPLIHFSISPSSDPAKGSIEEHLLERSRKTTIWSEDINQLNTRIVDKSSIVENRAFALYEEVPTSPANRESSGEIPTEENSREKKVALVPSNCSLHDYIVCLKGARLPFVIRDVSKSYQSDDIEKSSRQPMRCILIGECLINDFQKVDSVLCPTTQDEQAEDQEFVFV